MIVKVARAAEKQIAKLPVSEQRKIVRRLALLATQPFAGKKLAGEYADLRSLRAWPYRTVYYR